MSTILEHADDVRRATLGLPSPVVGEEWTLSFIDRLEIDGEVMHLAQLRNRETLELREQIVHLDPGKRPGRLLWRDRAERRIDEIDMKYPSPNSLVR